MTVNIPLDAELAGLLQMFKRPVADTVRELIVLDLYRQSRIFSGRERSHRLTLELNAGLIALENRAALKWVSALHRLSPLIEAVLREAARAAP